MPAGGRLAVETANVDLDDAFVHAHPGAAAGPHVRVTIRDSGTGLDEATQSRLFEPFFTAKRGVQGSGLSLPAVYGIIAQHGGYLAVDSEPHSGTTFRMYLPAVAGEGSSAVGTAATGSGGSEGHRDHPAHRARQGHAPPPAGHSRATRLPGDRGG